MSHVEGNAIKMHIARMVNAIANVGFLETGNKNARVSTYERGSNKIISHYGDRNACY